jgi:hypothetical protein
MKEKLFANVSGKLKTAAWILAVGGLLLTAAMGIYATYTTWQYIEYYGYGASYILTTLATYAAIGFSVLVSAWGLYAFAEIAENVSQMKESFYEDFDDSQWECDGTDCVSCEADCCAAGESDEAKAEDDK